jgi:polyisoprenoid-binding protein YceI
VAAVDPVAEPAPEEPSVVGAADYTLALGRNSLYVVVTYQRGTLGAALAHDHVVVATKYSGTVHWDPADPSACRVAVDVPASGLRVDPPGARARAGVEGDAPVEDQPKIEENFNSKRQLDSGAFPVLTFRSERCAARPDGRVDVTGPLTIRGVSRPTTVAMAIEADGETFTARGKLTANHGDFGMTPFSAAMGAVKNAEPLAFTLDLTGKVSR